MREAGDWALWVDGRLADIRAQGRWRHHREFDAWGPRGTLIASEGVDGELDGDRDVVSFASNDYLGLTTHRAVVDAAHRALDRWGAGSGAARLVTGTRPVHEELEAELASWKRTDRAVLFPTGFATNLGVLTTLGSAGVRIVSDELNHASIIDGARLARAEVAVAPHRDLAEVERLVREAPGPAIVVADTAFSMDGDVLDVAAWADVCRRTGALLVLDEAHAVLGPEPEPDAFDDVEVVRVGTLSKTLGALGGFAACSAPIADLLVNAARPAIFTTALSPADAAAGLAALHVLRSAEGARLQAALRAHVDLLRPGHPTPIVPIVIGDEAATLATARALLDRGLFVPAIRPPTVAPGTSRLRVTLSAAHTRGEVVRLRDALVELGALVPPETAAP